ncbi:MAG: cell envelope integrity protein TolA [Legionellaceae bacterium]|nr:cell envelope integrity protein TolA [Legionellaceae bacterium]
MMMSRSYRNAFIVAIALHISIVMMLLVERSTDRPVLTNDAVNEASSAPMDIKEQQAQAIKAVSVDSHQLMEEMNRLKDDRARQQQAEVNRQRALNQQAESARKQRVEEQKRIVALKNEAEKLAVAHKKQLIEEQKHQKEMALLKLEQEKHLADMKQQQVQLKKQQELETQKLAEIQHKKVDQLAHAEQARADQVKAELAKKQQEAAQQAATDAANRTRLTGVVDKYKALIINAISRQWILPDNANSSMSSQFRIRLAPNGAVLDVSLIRSSGDVILDRSAQAAIFKASPLPVPADPTTFDMFRDISLTVRPVNARG